MQLHSQNLDWEGGIVQLFVLIGIERIAVILQGLSCRLYWSTEAILLASIARCS